MATMGTGTTLSALIKGYESKPMRSLLTKLGNTKKGSKVEAQLLESALPALLAAQQAARARQEEK